MTETFERPFTDEERALLGRTPGFPPSWLDGVVGSLSLGVIGFLIVLLVLSFRSNGADVAPRGALFAGIVIAVFHYGRRQRRERLAASAESIARGNDLASGQARVTRYTATDAIGIQESEDEGMAFYLQLTDDRVLYLGGQYLDALADTQRFPATEFEISRVAASDRFLALTPRGRYLPPSSEREPFTAEEYEHDRIPEDRAFVEARFEDLRRVAV
ncbi:MAG: hypothetical protein ACREOC_06320 [Gemmatimonadales bacterium]